jgi:hypothetical protein
MRSPRREIVAWRRETPESAMMSSLPGALPILVMSEAIAKSADAAPVDTRRGFDRAVILTTPFVTHGRNAMAGSGFATLFRIFPATFAVAISTYMSRRKITIGMPTTVLASGSIRW